MLSASDTKKSAVQFGQNPNTDTPKQPKNKRPRQERKPKEKANTKAKKLTSPAIKKGVRKLRYKGKREKVHANVAEASATSVTTEVHAEAPESIRQPKTRSDQEEAVSPAKPPTASTSRGTQDEAVEKANRKTGTKIPTNPQVSHGLTDAALELQAGVMAVINQSRQKRMQPREKRATCYSPQVPSTSAPQQAEPSQRCLVKSNRGQRSSEPSGPAGLSPADASPIFIVNSSLDSDSTPVPTVKKIQPRTLRTRRLKEEQEDESGDDTDVFVVSSSDDSDLDPDFTIKKKGFGKGKGKVGNIRGRVRERGRVGKAKDTDRDMEKVQKNRGSKVTERKPMKRRLNLSNAEDFNQESGVSQSKKLRLQRQRAQRKRVQGSTVTTKSTEGSAGADTTLKPVSWKKTQPSVSNEEDRVLWTEEEVKTLHR